MMKQAGRLIGKRWGGGGVNICRGQIHSGNFDGTLKLVSLEIQLNFFQFHLLSYNKYPHIYRLLAQTEVSLPVFATS